MLTQTCAIIFAAYRELNAKKLFWITMGINLLAVVLYASLGINEKGVTLLHWSFQSDFMNTKLVSADMFYRLMFISWGIPIWLSWAASILALVSTAGIVPDLIRGGTIETLLSKPISRWRLFLTKYATGLLFVILQVFVFSLGCFLVLGIRGGAWDARLFLAVPIVVTFFSYLFAICAFFGMITKSTITALLLTCVIWLMLFVTNAADEILLQQREGVAVQVQDLEERESNQVLLRDMFREKAQDAGPQTPLGQGYTKASEDRQRDLEETREELEIKRQSLQQWAKWTSLVIYTRTVLPKTSETIGLLERHLMSREEMATLVRAGPGAPSNSAENLPPLADSRAASRANNAMRDRSILWIVGTSLIFESLILFITTWMFVRRDF